MTTPTPPKAAIVDYALGNLFSVAQACRQAGLEPVITSDRQEIMASQVIFLPGVGAFGDAMDNLKRLDLVEPLRQAAADGHPMVGICLGMQLFMSESLEFGRHQGLGLIEGPVVPFESPQGPRGVLKVPQVGWNTIHPPRQNLQAWLGTPLEDLPPGEFMYFVHSFYAAPQDPEVILTLTSYGEVEFCSALRRGNLLAFQFHPERSGPAGIQVYRRLAQSLT